MPLTSSPYYGTINNDNGDKGVYLTTISDWLRGRGLAIRLSQALMLLGLWGGLPVMASDLIWFERPASQWEGEVLPIGNGALGAAVAGQVSRERLQFNEKTLWTGGPQAGDAYDYGIPDSPYTDPLARVQDKLRRNGSLAPESVAAELGRKVHHYGHYQSFGELLVDYPGLDDSARRYHRQLDLQNGRATVTFEHKGVEYQREYFVSYPDQVIVMRVSANRPGRIDLRAGLAVPDNRSRQTAWLSSGLRVEGELKDNGLAYAAQLDIEVEGGSNHADREAGVWHVEGADAVTFRLSAATDYQLSYPRYRGESPAPKVQGLIEDARELSYAQLLERHTSDHQALFNRVSLDLGQAKPEKPTPRLLAEYGKDNTPAQDRALEALYFQFGRYLLIASSRDGSLPANLQGVWNHSETPPWNADYHVNINLQMNYWPAEVTNLSETTGPLFDFVDALIPPGERSAQQFFGADGWTLFLNTNIWGFTGVIDWPTAFWQPEAAAWLAQHYYEHYLFNRNETFLKERAYPAMRSAAQFWLDALIKDASGTQWLVSPSYSPEHGEFTEGAAMSQQLVWDLFRNTRDAALTLGDKTMAQRLDKRLSELDPGLRVGHWGQLQEWREDMDDPDSQHRHVSHLFALHPGRQITADQPELLDAARTTLNARGDGGTGWAQAWKINLWARLKDGDRAHKVLSDQLQDSTLDNLWDTHPPFQIDGNFGATAGMAEMLLQSHGEAIHLLPALPDVWSTGSVHGLRARGDITLSLGWRDGQLQWAELITGVDGPVAVRSELFRAGFSVRHLPTSNPVDVSGEGDVRQWPALAGHRYRIERTAQSDSGGSL